MNGPLKVVMEIKAVESREDKGELRTSLITGRIIVQRLVVISTENTMWDRKTEIAA